MRVSATIKKASDYVDKAFKLLEPINEDLAELLDDKSAHITPQTDGFVIAFNGGLDNAWLGFMEIEKLLKLNKESALIILKAASL